MGKIIKNFKNISYGPAPEDSKDVMSWINSLKNLILNHDFDFNNSNLLRNTLPYLVDEKFGDNDFIIESNETIRQISKIESVGLYISTQSSGSKLSLDL